MELENYVTISLVHASSGEFTSSALPCARQCAREFLTLFSAKISRVLVARALWNCAANRVAS
jgi:hypothetical protein